MALAKSYGGLAHVYIDPVKNSERALQAAKRGVVLLPSEPDGWRTLAIAHAAYGEWQRGSSSWSFHFRSALRAARQAPDLSLAADIQSRMSEKRMLEKSQEERMRSGRRVFEDL